MSDARVHEMIARACLGLGAAAEIAEDPRAFLEKCGLAKEDVDAICASPRRLGIYRRLVRNNLAGVVDKMMPRARARLNRAARAFDATLEQFLDERGPRTHYLRDVPREFL